MLCVLLDAHRAKTVAEAEVQNVGAYPLQLTAEHNTNHKRSAVAVGAAAAAVTLPDEVAASPPASDIPNVADDDDDTTLFPGGRATKPNPSPQSGVMSSGDEPLAAGEGTSDSEEEDQRIAYIRLEIKYKKRRFNSVLLASAEVALDDLPPHAEVRCKGLLVYRESVRW